MTVESANFLVGFFAHIWNLYNGWKLPGTDVTPIAWALFLVMVVIFIKSLKRILNTRDSSAGRSAPSSPSGGGKK